MKFQNSGFVNSLSELSPLMAKVTTAAKRLKITLPASRSVKSKASKVLSALDDIDMDEIDREIETSSASSSDSETRVGDEDDVDEDLDNEDEDDEDEDDDEEDNEDAEDEVEVLENDDNSKPEDIGCKRKHGSYRKQGVSYLCPFQILTTTLMTSTDAPTLPAAPPVVKIVYNVSILSATELKKKKNARQPLSCFTELASDLEWVDVKDNILILIIDALNLPNSSYDDHDVLFSVPRYVPNSLPLKSDTDYSHLLKNAIKAKNDPSAKILVTQKTPTASNLFFLVIIY
jgi:hypothetical protein